MSGLTDENGCKDDDGQTYDGESCCGKGCHNMYVSPEEMAKLKARSENNMPLRDDENFEPHRFSDHAIGHEEKLYHSFGEDHDEEPNQDSALQLLQLLKGQNYNDAMDILRRTMELVETRSIVT